MAKIHLDDPKSYNAVKRRCGLVIIVENLGNIYLFKVNNRNTRRRCEICSTIRIAIVKLTIKTPDRRYWRPFGVFFVNFEHISHILLAFLLLTLNR